MRPAIGCRAPRRSSSSVKQAPRAQTYLADRLAAEGWFDKTSTYDPDEYAGTNNRWFPLTTTGEPVLLRTPTGSQQEWQRAFDMWDEHGERNAMKMSESRRFALMNTAEVRSTPSSQIPDSDKDIEESGMSRAKIEAHNALVYFEQNRSGANYNYFLETANAEKADITVQARKLLWDADQSRQSGRNNLATEQYRMALAKWRQVLETYKDFHRPYNSEKNEEDTYEFETQTHWVTQRRWRGPVNVPGKCKTFPGRSSGRLRCVQRKIICKPWPKMRQSCKSASSR